MCNQGLASFSHHSGDSMACLGFTSVAHRCKNELENKSLLRSISDPTGVRGSAQSLGNVPGIALRIPGSKPVVMGDVAKLFRPGVNYSALRAVTGEMDAARVAGMMAAKNAEMASALAARANANGSQMETP